jgi:hypothetical protein
MSKRKHKVLPPGIVAQTQKNKCLDGTFIDHKKYLKLYRHHTMRIIRDVRRGVVNEIDMDKLQNFIQFSLALMDRANMEDIDKAWRNAEAMSFIHADMGIEVVETIDERENYEGILDPVVQAATAQEGKPDGKSS